MRLRTVELVSVLLLGLCGCLVFGTRDVPGGVLETDLVVHGVVAAGRWLWTMVTWLWWCVVFHEVWQWCGRRRGQRRHRCRGRPEFRASRKRRGDQPESVDGTFRAISPCPEVREAPSAAGCERTCSSGSAAPNEPLTVVLETAAATDTTVAAWVQHEVGQTALGDARLTTRLGKLVTDCMAHPTASIPEACGTWKATKAAYRFFDNTRLSHPKLLHGSYQACVDRLPEGEMVLVVQDTTSLDYTSHPATKDVGPLEATSHQGLFVHSCLAVSASGVPLGLLDQQTWARDPATTGKRASRKQRPIKQKESFKWLKGLRKSLDGVPNSVCLVTVADQEADIFDLFLDAEQHETQVLIRSAWDRCVQGPVGHLQADIEQQPVADTYVVSVGRAPGRQPREARMALRFTTVSVLPPQHRRKDPRLHPLTLSAVDVQEISPPEGEKPLHWRLLTSLSIRTCADAHRCVRWYSLRWLVERYHFVLKSGCRIEQRQLETGARLRNCLAVYAIVAWRLLWLTYKARQAPHASCESAFERDEWQALYCLIHHTPVPPETPPSLEETVRWLAQLGGFLNRKGDGVPGVKVLWRGWQRLEDSVAMWRLLHPPPRCG